MNLFAFLLGFACGSVVLAAIALLAAIVGTWRATRCDDDGSSWPLDEAGENGDRVLPMTDGGPGAKRNA